MWSAGLKLLMIGAAACACGGGQRHHDRQQRHHRKSTSPERNGKLHFTEKGVRFGKKPEGGEMNEGKINGKHSRGPTTEV